MPVLHKHPGRNEYYVVTSNNGTVATFKLTGKGMKRLRSVGLADGENFDTSILLDLYRSGDAFTHGRVTAEAKGKSPQMKFDFLNESSAGKRLTLLQCLRARGRSAPGGAEVRDTDAHPLVPTMQEKKTGADRHQHPAPPRVTGISETTSDDEKNREA